MHPSLSTEKIAAFVELARQGSLREVARQLHITEQGVRNRLLALEDGLGVELYRKQRGVRRGSVLTEQGARFLPHAVEFLARANNLTDLFRLSHATQEVYVAASQYLTFYVLIDALRRFHSAHPRVHVRLSTRAEEEIEGALLDDAQLALGIAAPYDTPSELEYAHLFSMDWSLVAPRGHPLLKAPRVRLHDLADQPLIFFERGSTGRQHVMEAFQQQNLSPRVDMEVTSTQIVVRMVEAGLGLAIVPLLPNGDVTRGVRVGVRSLGKKIRPIHSGILRRRGEQLHPAAQQFIDFVSKDKLLRKLRR